MRVLFVEDDSHVTNAANRFFRQCAGWELEVARDGTEALRKFESTDYDTVLIDWTLPKPGPDGLEVCRHIRRVSQVPVIFVTARESTEDVIEALGAGADEYVTKPFDPRALLARMEALVRRSSLPPAHAARGLPAPANDGSSGPILAPSRRHAQILECLSRGLANKEIAGALGCSVKNVEYHLGRMLRKTGCSSRAQLVARARVRDRSSG